MASTFFHVLRLLLAKIPVVLTLCHFWVLSQSPLKGWVLSVLFPWVTKPLGDPAARCLTLDLSTWAKKQREKEIRSALWRNIPILQNTADANVCSCPNCLYFCYFHSCPITKTGAALWVPGVWERSCTQHWSGPWALPGGGWVFPMARVSGELCAMLAPLSGAGCLGTGTFLTARLLSG